ncbi:major facilitator superfamily MFS_1 (plasmid) [Haloterrigena turkmenica DSM 5511]|uniref:Major facilitator superfamily MFS_1 n=1 Tax=Haloterrigena turkmenica (strain ATCC 51198 / DSM 5511 / JCM 9101 / NCIMB 13204 / VKM B-1734 / 4k) TaxID=543526 RepID=D2S000_HALTV|nr:MFS transporter [Haloterrigena turkmenica]ADB62697.1 major facilitator superfamily MFS_1 [Haloterrigena turkmenica DSM 5511]
MSYLPQAKEKLRGLRQDGRGRILLTVATGWGLTIGGRMVYPVLLPHLRSAYGLSLSSAGVLLTVLFAAYAIGQLPSGVLTDRIGEVATLVVSMGVSAAAIVLIVTAGSTLFLYASTAVYGFGIGLYAIARFTALDNVYSEHFGTAIGVTNSASEIGQAALPPVAGFLAVALGWQYGFGFTVPLFVLVACALWIYVPQRSPTETNADDALSLETGRYLCSQLSQPSIVRGTAIFVLGISIWQAFTGFYPTYLVEVKGLSSTAAGGVFGLYFALAAFVHPISGTIYDRWGLRYTFLLVGVSVVALALLPVVEGLWSLVALTVPLSALLAFGTATESYLVDALPDDVAGTGFGLLRTISFGLGAASPVLFGAAADRGFFDEVFLLLAGLAGLMVLLATQIPAD